MSHLETFMPAFRTHKRYPPAKPMELYIKNDRVKLKIIAPLLFASPTLSSAIWFRLAGDLRYIVSPDIPYKASGELSLRGTFEGPSRDLRGTRSKLEEIGRGLGLRQVGATPRQEE
jgi:hypothetical protein